MPLPTTAHRLLRSSLVDVLLGPYGIDRYLELIRKDLTVREARGRVVSVTRQTPRSVTLTVRPNDAWQGFAAGQFVSLGLDIDGVRRTRTYSPASSPSSRDGLLEFTVTAHPEGLVSSHLCQRLRPGTVLHLGEARGDFVLPEPRPRRLVLISGGSGITPVLAMLRTLIGDGYDGDIAFLHYARTRADWLYRDEVIRLAQAHPNLRVHYAATREGDRRIDEAEIRRLLGDRDPAESWAAVCGPRPLIESVREIWAEAPDQVLTESFTPPSFDLGPSTEGTLRFVRSEMATPVSEGTLLEQAEQAGLTPDFGCRMGICHTCTCRKRAGAVRNVRTGQVSVEENEDIQLCISVPAGDVELEI